VVGHLVWDQGIGGSNPLTPTKEVFDVRTISWFVGRLQGMKKVDLKYRFFVWGFCALITAFVLLLMIATNAPYPWLYAPLCVILFAFVFPLSFIFGSVQTLEAAEKRDEERKQKFLKDVDKSLDELSDWYVNDVETHVKYHDYITPEMKRKLIKKIISKLREV
jgi:hypothetical protein